MYKWIGIYRFDVKFSPSLSDFLVTLMRRQGQYADSGGNAYVSAQMHSMPAQRMEQKSDHFQGQLEASTPERDQPYGTPKSDGQ
ncbi:hypothetical protein CRYUN_Cryun25bG0072700 [Craigia yunnanensis]